MSPWRVESPWIRAEVQPLGAMLGPAEFRLADGRWVQPFAVAPWAQDDSAEHSALPGILQRLRGEWPCVPFGNDTRRCDLPSDWQPQSTPAPHSEENPHGFGANNLWSLVDRGADWLLLEVGYPADESIARLERRIAALPDHAGIALSLTIHPRQTIALPLGLHPVYALPAAPDRLMLELPPTARVWTFPQSVEPGRSLVVPDQRDTDPRAVRLVTGVTTDVHYLPMQGQSEDLVLLAGLDGHVGLQLLDRGFRIDQHWPGQILPCCLLWISAQGREYYPWSGRFRGLGVEPIAAPFDLGPATAGANPLTRAGIATAIQLHAGEALTINYSIAVRAI